MTALPALASLQRAAIVPIQIAPKTSVWEQTQALLYARARRTVAYELKLHARLYIKRPLLLENVHAGLSYANADQMIAIGKMLLADEQRNGCRRYGCEDQLLNAKTVILLGRGLRRAERRVCT